MQLDNKYEIISNRERGSGRLDILLKSKLIDRASFLIELKYTKAVSYTHLRYHKQHPHRLSVPHKHPHGAVSLKIPV